MGGEMGSGRNMLHLSFSETVNSNTECVRTTQMKFLGDPGIRHSSKARAAPAVSNTSRRKFPRLITW